jgi:hypothetical protein
MTSVSLRLSKMVLTKASMKNRPTIGMNLPDRAQKRLAWWDTALVSRCAQSDGERVEGEVKELMCVWSH